MSISQMLVVSTLVSVFLLKSITLRYCAILGTPAQTSTYVGTLTLTVGIIYLVAFPTL
jgi:hypothetical protein